MTLIPARDRDQGLPPGNRLNRFDMLVPPSRAPTDADSTDSKPYLPDGSDVVRQAREQAEAQLVPSDVATRQATRDADWAKQLEAYEAEPKPRSLVQ